MNHVQCVGIKYANASHYYVLKCASALASGRPRVGSLARNLVWGPALGGMEDNYWNIDSILAEQQVAMLSPPSCCNRLKLTHCVFTRRGADHTVHISRQNDRLLVADRGDGGGARRRAPKACCLPNPPLPAARRWFGWLRNIGLIPERDFLKITLT